MSKLQEEKTAFLLECRTTDDGGEEESTGMFDAARDQAMINVQCSGGGSWIDSSKNQTIKDNHFPAYCAPCPEFEWYKYNQDRIVGNWTCSYEDQKYTCDLHCIFDESITKQIFCNTGLEETDPEWKDESNEFISTSDINELTCPPPPKQYCNRKLAEEQSGAIFECDGDQEAFKPVKIYFCIKRFDQTLLRISLKEGQIARLVALITEFSWRMSIKIFTVKPAPSLTWAGKW